MLKKINYKYLVLFIIFLFIEIFIALFVRDKIIRPFVGDILVIFLIYFFIKIFLNKEIKLLSFYIFLFAFLIEMLQYFKIVEILHLNDNIIAKTIIGTTFDIKDIICYFVGFVLIMIFEKLNFI